MRDRFKITFGIYNEAIQPLIDHCETTPGAKAELKRRFEEATGRKWRKENFTRWLHADKKIRVEPSYGIGTLLIQIGREIMGG